MNNIKLDKDEQEILKSFEQGEWKSVQNVKEEKMKHRQYARNTLKRIKGLIFEFLLKFWKRSRLLL